MKAENSSLQSYHQNVDMCDVEMWLEIGTRYRKKKMLNCTKPRKLSGGFGVIFVIYLIVSVIVTSINCATLTSNSLNTSIENPSLNQVATTTTTTTTGTQSNTKPRPTITTISEYLNEDPGHYDELVECGGNLTVSFNASLLHFPKSSNHTPIHCRWILKAPPGQRVAISSTFASYKFPVDFVHWIAFEGDEINDLAKIISYTELRDSHIDGDWLPGINDNPILTKSNVLLLDYVSFGDGPMEADMLYYSCGGTIYGNGIARSPVFPFPELTGTALLLQCTWEFIMPEESLFSSVQFLDMNNRDDCSVLHVQTNGIMKTILLEDFNNTTSLNATSRGNKNKQQDLVMDVCKANYFVSKSMSKQTLNYANENKENSSTESSNDSEEYSEMYLCTKNIIFEEISSNKIFVTGRRTYLNYTLPCILQDIGFKLEFTSYDHYSSMLTKYKPRPIYVTYAGILIWMPIGAILGCFIICHQTKRKDSTTKFFRKVNIDGVEVSMFDSSEDPSSNTKADTKVTLNKSGTELTVALVNCPSSNEGVVKSIMKNKFPRKNKETINENFGESLATHSGNILGQCNNNAQTLNDNAEQCSDCQLTEKLIPKHVKFETKNESNV